MLLKNIAIAIIAIILAIAIFQVMWWITAFIIRIVIFLIVAYIVYLFLKKSL